MISEKNLVFRLSTEDTSYWFRITPFGHAEHIYYGPFLTGQAVDGLLFKHSSIIGSSVAYDDSDPNYCLDGLCLEWSGIGRGDYRFSPAEIKMPDGTFVNDFTYQSHKVTKGNVLMETLPSSYGTGEECETLSLLFADKSNQVELTLYYTVYEASNVITRRVVLENKNGLPLTIRRLLSMMMDLPNRSYRIHTFDGGWIKEAHRHERPVEYGMLINSSTTGSSSNRHNPGFLLAEEGAGENHGRVYGFNLVYSGCHFGGAELSNQQLVRVFCGISPHCFEWVLSGAERFETPEAVMTFSGEGFNGLSHNFHDFINHHIVRSDWKGKERPVLINSWEAHFFDFTQGKLLKLAKQAKKLGIELFVLDDGWFGDRGSDHSGLGDYTVNQKKLPWGINNFAERIKALGLSFGLWFEPEMVNEDSDLYRAHPEYAVKTPGKKPTLGRNQLVLDLCSEEVRDYIVSSVESVLDTACVSYVKWDMNRHISDMFSAKLTGQGEFLHRYIIGLYDILNRIFTPRPHILLESCSSGGNRFDLGMLCFSPQIWASDNTDPVERLKIQGGLSYLYPPSAMGAHVSGSPHQQTLRCTPLSTRFNVACFGCLGYELDLKYLTPIEKKEIKDQISFYKKHRKTFQYGIFSRIPTHKSNKVQWQSKTDDGSAAITGFFQTQAGASESFDILPVTGLDRDRLYRISTRGQNIYIKKFGGLVKHVLPLALNPDGFLLRVINRIYCLRDCEEQYEGEGVLMEEGVLLNNQFMGSWYNEQTRILGDYGSNLYVTQMEDSENG